MILLKNSMKDTDTLIQEAQKEAEAIDIRGESIQFFVTGQLCYVIKDLQKFVKDLQESVKPV